MKNVTLVAIDFKLHELTKRAIEITLRNFTPKEILVISDQEIISGANTVIRSPVSGMPEYANIMLKGVAEHINTDHALYVQWDGIAYNKDLWTDEFLKYDYIGAPWPWQPEGRNIGNGGFSLRSKRLLDICANDNQISLTSSEPIAEDNIIGQHNRVYLEQKGIMFSSTEIAKQFSYELGDYRDSFGFHGLWNIVNNLNGDDLDFFMNRLDYRGWNIHKWIHFITALVNKESHYLTIAIDQLEKHNPEYLQHIAQVIST